MLCCFGAAACSACCMPLCFCPGKEGRVTAAPCSARYTISAAASAAASGSVAGTAVCKDGSDPSSAMLCCFGAAVCSASCMPFCFCPGKEGCVTASPCSARYISSASTAEPSSVCAAAIAAGAAASALTDTMCFCSGAADCSADAERGVSCSCCVFAGAKGVAAGSSISSR